MRRKGTLTASLVAVIAAAAAALSPSVASAATSSIPFKACPNVPSFGCARLSVPLDPSGATPGTISLAIRRELSATGTANTAVVALAGGPGQAALPFATTASQVVSSALKNDDLVVFDQRGTGDSGPLKCSALNSVTAPISQVIPDCATQIGVARAFYTTDDTVADIEAIRKALGYTKLILYGTSYGTKVALRYAAIYPDNVAGLLLDSTVPPNGPPLYDQTTYEAVPRILREACAGGCHGINPVADLRTVLRRLAAKPAHVIYRQSTGKELHLKIHAVALASILITGDEDPSLRADFPAALHAAADGRYALLGILYAHAILGQLPDKTINNPLYFDTECEELPFPRDATPAERIADGLAAVKAMPAGTFGPFSAVTAYRESTAPDCAYWPNATAAPETDLAALPDVPTLIISGADDLRTPTANADAVAAMIPDAKVVVVPQTGHSVLTTEFGACGRDAVNAFFTGQPIETVCEPRSQPAYLRPAPAPPASLHSVTPLPGTTAGAGRTAHAIELTLGWSNREVDESYFETLIGVYNPAFSKGLGGLYSGFAKVTEKQNGRTTMTFHGFSYVPGLTISGRLTQGVGTLRVGGSTAAGGTLTAVSSNDFVGKLGGVTVHFRISAARLAALIA
ncbi:MAG TPA: alpha/beta hydrolase [Solirubrobacteraceae bacterium]|jgi:pimeloyl-ACP methyl ester carboxylesterase|nr:alpha/beta hydrolase [Solirubrobacteraceae bacterium]